MTCRPTRRRARYALLSAALLLGAPAIAQDQAQSSTPATAEEQPAAESGVETVREKVLDCAGEKFVFAWGAGAKPTKVTLCSEAGATTEEVVVMLDDAAGKIERSGIPEDRRTAIVQQIRGKIAQLKGEAALAIPPAQVAPAEVAPAPVDAPAVAEAAPTPAPVRKSVAAAPAPAATAALPKPRLGFECYTPGQIGSGGPCTILGRETRVTVRSADALPAGTSLRFVRNGESRAEVALGRFRKGQKTTFVLPSGLCSGVVEAETEIRVARGGQVVDTVGPFLLRC